MPENTTAREWAEIRLQDAEEECRRAHEALTELEGDETASAESLHAAEAWLEDASLAVEGATAAFERSKEGR